MKRFLNNVLFHYSVVACVVLRCITLFKKKKRYLRQYRISFGVDVVPVEAERSKRLKPRGQMVVIEVVKS